jgi:hypothetical protein
MSAGILGTLVVNPLDVRKVRMQQGKSGNVVHIVREGGAAALYKGLAANVTRGATVTAVEFSLFDQLKVNNASAPPVCVWCSAAGVGYAGAKRQRQSVPSRVDLWSPSHTEVGV